MADTPPTEAGPGAFARAGRMFQILTAAVSLSLVAGAGVWGYQLLKRDAQGIPVVRALDGPMRERPADAGGEVALHTGLAVNAVAAQGAAAEPEDRLLLAPRGQGLTEEDLIARPNLQREAEPLPAEAEADAEVLAPARLLDPDQTREEDLSEAEVMALADIIASGADPLQALQPLPEEPAPLALGAEPTPAPERIEVIAASVPGVTRAPRPPGRPAAAVAPAADPVAAALREAVASGPRLRSAPIPAGTALVQLGAYPTEDRAATAWGRLEPRFADYLDGRDPVLLRVETGDAAFYRLRLMGFDGLGDARRFCAALTAEGADCIYLVSD